MVREEVVMTKLLLTGAFGFIGSNFQELYRNNFDIFRLDSLCEVHAVKNKDCFVRHHSDKLTNFSGCDFTNIVHMNNLFEEQKFDIVLHMGAQSNVDCSIASAVPFIQSNVLGTQVLVDMAVKHKVRRFIYISTDEVYGHLQPSDPPWTEASPTNPRNPYSASKLAGELVVKAAHETHNLQYSITRSCNNFGKYQAERNLIPKIITCLKDNKPVPIHGDGTNTREWIHVRDNCRAIKLIIDKAPPNETYNIGSGWEKSNNDMVKLIAKEMNKEPNIKYIEDRKGHDRRYAVATNKLCQLAGDIMGTYPHEPDNTGREEILETIDWYMQ
jgi:dTDP-glucose 4,6-dehydratase